MNAFLRPILTAALVLGGFALISAIVMAWVEQLTSPVIARNQVEAMQASFAELLPPQHYDNNPVHDVITVQNQEVFGTSEPVEVHRARRAGQPVAVLATVTAPDGYSGSIHLLVAVHHHGALAGVRILQHRETPGLGDAIEARRSDWIHAFTDRSLGDPPASRWKVRKDGGDFDQFTGATITPRAVVAAVRRFLEYHRANREQLFAEQEEVTSS